MARKFTIINLDEKGDIMGNDQPTKKIEEINNRFKRDSENLISNAKKNICEATITTIKKIERTHGVILQHKGVENQC